MKNTVIGGPLLLVALFAVSWVAAAPLEAVSEEEDLNEALKEFMKENPSVAKDLYPQLVSAAEQVSLTIDPDVVLDLVENYVKDATARDIVDQLDEDEEGEEEAAGTRQKRQTSVSGSIDGGTTNYGRSISGSAGVSHAWNNERHSLGGIVGARRDTITGVGGFNSYNAGVGYNFKPDKRTSLGINAQRSWTPGGNSNTFGLSFERKFGR